jgi:hypothetical protein
VASATMERVLERVREAGRDGVTHPLLVEYTGAPKGAVTRAVNTLERDNLVRYDGELVRPVLRRGRRLIQTEERDEEAYRAILDSGSEGLSVLDLAGVLGVGRGLAYQSIYRLRMTSRISRRGVTRTARWVAEADQAA